MGPIEVLWGTVLLIFVIISVIRGYNRELGVTVILLLILFVELQFGNVIEARIRQQVLARVFPEAAVVRTLEREQSVAIGEECEALQERGNKNQELTSEVWANFIVMLMFQLPIMVIVFWSYAGRTLSFPGTPPRGLEGFFFNVLVGFVNGYLVAGTLWYYLHKYRYPVISQLNLFYPECMTPRAKDLVRYLPPALFDARPELLAMVAAVLIFVYVRR